MNAAVKERPHCVDGQAHDFVHIGAGTTDEVHGGGRMYYRTDYFSCRKCLLQAETNRNGLSYGDPPLWYVTLP